MNYTEWRDELKDNLLSVSESERKRVLEYYAEAYADRREAGFSEREIIAGFGAPYDAAQRILAEGGDAAGAQSAPAADHYPENRQNNERRYDEHTPPPPQSNYRDERTTPPPPPLAPARDTGRTVVFVILCILLAAPAFGILMGLVGITIGLCVAPFAVLISGAGAIASGIGAMIAGDLYYGLCTLASGIIVIGVGVILMAIFKQIVKFLWWAWNKAIGYIKSFFSGRSRA